MSLFLIFFCGLFYYLSFSFAGEARGFPHFMIFFLFLFSLSLFVNTFFSKEKQTKDTDTSDNGIDIKRLFYVAALTIIYIVLINKVGFYFTTILYLFYSMYYLGIKNVKLLLLITGIFIIFLYTGFTLFLELSIPEGILF